MSQKKSILEIDKNKINFIMSQTTLTEDETINKLIEYDNDIFKIIKENMGIDSLNTSRQTNKKNLNQEIYRQLRKHLDIKSYREKNPINVNDVINSFQESDNYKK
jgi:hypothetical protein